MITADAFGVVLLMALALDNHQIASSSFKLGVCYHLCCFLMHNVVLLMASCHELELGGHPCGCHFEPMCVDRFQRRYLSNMVRQVERETAINWVSAITCAASSCTNVGENASLCGSVLGSTGTLVNEATSSSI
jgi:hypothetical protein